MTELDNSELREAWDRIARTTDGLIVYRHLQKICLEKPPSLDNCALPFHEGRRSLAFDLMATMSAGIGDNDRACVTFRTAKSGASTAASTRRVTLDDNERVGNTELDRLLADAAPTFRAPTGNGTGGASS